MIVVAWLAQLPVNRVTGRYMSARYLKWASDLDWRYLR